MHRDEYGKKLHVLTENVGPIEGEFSNGVISANRPKDVGAEVIYREGRMDGPIFPDGA